mgnify:CR=1 FL=1
MKKTIVFFFILFLSACSSFQYYPVDNYGHLSSDKFGDDLFYQYGIVKEGKISVLSKNTVKACDFSSLEEAKHYAYIEILNLDSQNKIKSTLSNKCTVADSTNGCVTEQEIYNEIYDQKQVSTKKENNCYIFKFKQTNKKKSFKTTDQFSVFDREFVYSTESLVKINFVNANVPVKSVVNGRIYYITGAQTFKYNGPGVFEIKVIDKRFESRTIQFKIPAAPKIINKNISLVNVNPFKRKVEKNIGLDFERQDYKKCYKEYCKKEEFYSILKNRNELNLNGISITNNKVKNTYNLLTSENFLSGTEFKIKIFQYKFKHKRKMQNQTLIAIKHNLKRQEKFYDFEDLIVSNKQWYYENMYREFKFSLIITLYVEGNEKLGEIKYKFFFNRANLSGGFVDRYTNNYISWKGDPLITLSTYETNKEFNLTKNIPYNEYEELNENFDNLIGFYQIGKQKKIIRIEYKIKKEN